MFRGSFKGVQGNFKEVQEVLQLRFKDVSRKSQGCFKGISMKLQGCFNKVFGCFKEASWLFKKKV